MCAYEKELPNFKIKEKYFLSTQWMHTFQGEWNLFFLLISSMHIFST